jgi:hypothetical protein
VALDSVVGSNQMSESLDALVRAEFQRMISDALTGLACAVWSALSGRSAVLRKTTGGCPTRSTSRNKGGRKSGPGGLAKVRFPVTREGERIVGLSLVPLYALARAPARVEEEHKGKGKGLRALSVSVDKMIGYQVGLPRSLP